MYDPHFFVAAYCIVLPFREAKFCGEPSRTIVKVWYDVGTNIVEHWSKGPTEQASLSPTFTWWRKQIKFPKRCETF
jgi:hypothetical protein